MKTKKTERGFVFANFEDRDGAQCSLQKSSLATENCIWLGLNNVEPIVIASKLDKELTGWLPYLLPQDVHITSRMHLSQEQVKELLPVLQKFVETGEII